jgi:hypothetical protein
MEGKEGLLQCTALHRMQLTGRKFGPKPTDLQSIMRAWEGLEVLFLVSQPKPSDSNPIQNQSMDACVWGLMGTYRY